MKAILFPLTAMLVLLVSCGSPVVKLAPVTETAVTTLVSIDDVVDLHNGEDSDPTATPDEPSSPKVRSQFVPSPKTPTPPQPTATAEPGFMICSPLLPYPLEELREIVSDPYRPPPPGKEERHHGVDFSHYRRGDLLSIEGVPVQAVLAGRVATVQADSFPYGNFIILETVGDFFPDEWQVKLDLSPQDSVYILYAHLQDLPRLQTGERVDACQVLGTVGKSGNTVEAHLHLETRRGPPGVTFPAMGYYQADSTEAEKETYLRWRIGGEFVHFDPMDLLKPQEVDDDG